MKTTAEKIAVMQAFERGEKIEVCNSKTSWKPIYIPALCNDPHWNWEDMDYRVAPKPLESWFTVYPDGSIGGRYSGKDEASQWLGDGGRIVHMREVTP